MLESIVLLHPADNYGSHVGGLNRLRTGFQSLIDNPSLCRPTIILGK